MATDSLTERRRQAGCGPRAVFGLFLVIGLVVLFFLTIRPTLRIWQARSWKTLPCRIVSAEVKSHSGDDSTTYSVDIVYEYNVNGQSYRSNRYDFIGGSSRGYESKQRIVTQYRSNKTPVCYVNPSDPHDAVLMRRMSSSGWFGLIPGAFVLIGLIGIIKTRKRTDVAPPMTARTYLATPPTRGDAAGAIVLKPQQSPVTKLVMLTLFAAFWNGIISIFVTQAVSSWRTSAPEIFLSLFMIPFVLVGLGLIFAIGYTAISIFNPRITLTLGNGLPCLGETISLLWTFTGRYDRIQALHIKLEAREEATYTRGTETVTDRHVFHSQKLLDAVKQIEIVRGSTKFTIPGDAMHSFTATNNKIIWSLEVHGEIPNWPDVKEQFTLNVLPAREVKS